MIGKNNLKKAIIIILAGILLTGCGSSKEEEIQDSPEIEESIEQEVESEEEVKQDVEDEVEEVVDKTQSEQLFLELLKESFDNIAEVSFDETSKAYNIFPTGEVFINEIIMVANGDQELLKSWNALADELKNISKSISDGLGSGYSLNMLNPLDDTKVLLMLTEGIAIYDFKDEI